MRRSTADDRGFVLIAAVWLLLLAGAIVAVLMLRGIGAAKSADADAIRLRTELDRASIVQSVVADRAINGRRSYWSRMPARATVSVRGRLVTVGVTSEGNRTDLNTVDLGTLDSALLNLQISAPNRALLEAALRDRRSKRRLMASWSEVQALLMRSGLAGGGAVDLSDRVAFRGEGGTAALSAGSSTGLPSVPYRNVDTFGGVAAARGETLIRIRTTLDMKARGPAIVQVTGGSAWPYLMQN